MLILCISNAGYAIIFKRHSQPIWECSGLAVRMGLLKVLRAWHQVLMSQSALSIIFCVFKAESGRGRCSWARSPCVAALIHLFAVQCNEMCSFDSWSQFGWVNTCAVHWNALNESLTNNFLKESYVCNAMKCAEWILDKWFSEGIVCVQCNEMCWKNPGLELCSINFG